MSYSSLKNILISFIIIISFLSICGCDDPKYEVRPHYDYWVRVDGLGNYTTESGSARFMVPVPMYNGTPVLPFSGVADKDVSHSMGWDTEYVSLNARGYHGLYHGTEALFVNETAYGPLMSIRQNQTDYFKVDLGGDPGLAALITNKAPDELGFYRYDKGNYSFDRVTVYLKDMIGPTEDARTNATVEALADMPLYPDAGNVDTRYTVRVNNSTAAYTTYIYIDEGLRPIKPGNNTLEIVMVFELVVGYHPYGDYGSHRFFAIRESIPEGVTGYVPVTVQYVGAFDEYFSSEAVYDIMPYR